MVQIIGFVVYWAISVYLFVLMLRVVLDWVTLLAREWRPKGIVLVVANFIYALTDPPVHLVGKVVPPLRIGGISLDMGFLVLFLLLVVIQRLAFWAAFSMML